jgi:WD40 repeat protein
VCGETQDISIFNSYNGTPIWSDSGISESVGAVSFSSDGRHVFAGPDQYGFIAQRNAETGKFVKSIETDIRYRPGRFPCISPDRRYLANWKDDGTIKIWSLDDGKELKPFKIDTTNIWRISFVGKNQQFIVVLTDKEISLWNISSGQKILYVDKIDMQSDLLSASGNGRWLITAISTGTTLLYELVE